mmetsp:Transcript_24936/g.53978  ORF Transcript_24936/g.53978 Transcript_24936/m.53978 type:complete len:81 (-) Transcript_24936:742-984(-)
MLGRTGRDDTRAVCMAWVPKIDRLGDCVWSGEDLLVSVAAVDAAAVAASVVAVAVGGGDSALPGEAEAWGCTMARAAMRS